MVYLFNVFYIINKNIGSFADFGIYLFCCLLSEKEKILINVGGWQGESRAVEEGLKKRQEKVARLTLPVNYNISMIIKL